jgi:hypothetical protein
MKSNKKFKSDATALCGLNLVFSIVSLIGMFTSWQGDNSIDTVILYFTGFTVACGAVISHLFRSEVEKEDNEKSSVVPLKISLPYSSLFALVGAIVLQLLARRFSPIPSIALLILTTYVWWRKGGQIK